MSESTWRLPPRGVLLAAVVLIACAEVGGAAMARFRLELTRWARATMLARPEVHGLVGVRDVDEQIIDEALTKFDAGLRLFHLHGEGMGTVVIVSTMVASTLARSPAVRQGLVTFLAVGGLAYPFGYLLWSTLIPFYGIEPGKRIAEWAILVPFGGTSIAALWALVVVVAARLVPARRSAAP